MDADKIAQAFSSAGIEKNITCLEAFSIAERYNISKKEICDYCNSHGIRIRGYQLGCFK
ncbi:MAG: hypothetical protein Q8N94_08615 [Methanoregula sp.]|nr:hypothetical protein [Methanoregula sp.]